MRTKRVTMSTTREERRTTMALHERCAIMALHEERDEDTIMALHARV